METPTLIIITGIAIRIAIPILITGALTFALRRLNDYWQSQAKMEAETEEQIQSSPEKTNKDMPVHAHI